VVSPVLGSTRNYPAPLMAPSETYSKNYLSDVICRVDFSDNPAVKDELPTDIKSGLLGLFPRLEPLKQFSISVTNQDSEVTTDRQENITWRFSASDQSQFVEINTTSLIILTKKYTNYTAFQKIIEQVCNLYFGKFPEAQVTRLGLRYINQIILEEPNLFDWSKYINNHLLSAYTYFEDNEKSKRIFSTVERQEGPETVLSFKFGTFNGLYPNVISKKEFILDFDCYTQIAFENKDLLNKVNSFNEIITQNFEKSITDDFRNKLR